MLQPQLPSSVPQKKGRGCFFYFFITLMVIVTLCVIGGYLFVRSMVQKFTTTDPIVLAPFDPSQAELEAVAAKMERFVMGLKGQSPAVPLVLNERELNSLLALSPDFEKFKDKIRLRIQGSLVGGQVNIPADELGFPGRFISGDANFDLFLAHGMMYGHIKSLTINGWDLPDAISSELMSKNILEDAFDKPEEKELLEKLESIEIRGDTLVILPKGYNNSLHET